jgi:predicted ATPase/DNA-binding SARP family transcriptional activator
VVEFGILGRIRATDAVGGAVDLGPPRRRAVLAALLLADGRPLPVAVLVDELWGESPPSTAATMVHTAVSGLRHVLGSELLRTEEDGYVLGRAGLDARRFEELLAEGWRAADPHAAVEAFAAALRLWRGPALAGIDLPFARRAAERLELLRADCADLHDEAALALGRHLDVVAALERRVAADPGRERTLALLMLAHYRCGRPEAALAAAREVRSAVAAEPGPRIVRLAEAIRSGNPTLDLPPAERAGLPTPVGVFVGRERERAELAALLDGHRLVTIVGPGGVGKTRLAVEVARGRSGPVRLVDLVPVAEPALVTERVVSALGVRPAPGETAEAALREALRGDAGLVVLDNCEHLLDACAELVQTTAGRFLVTTREPLRVPGERAYPLAPLRLAAPGADPATIARCEAVRLFAARARPGFSVRPEDANDVLTLCRRLDGLPLALELAAARTATLAVPDLLARLADDLLTARTTDPRHRSLTATLTWSNDLLPAPARALLTRLSVFPATFDLAAAEAVAGPDVVAGLDQLVSASTVQTDGNRYRLLETTRAFARRQLTEPEPLRRRHAEHVLALAEQAWPHLFGPAAGGWLDRLHVERENWRAALDWAAGADPGIETRLVNVLWHYWDLRGSRDEGLRRVHGALTRTTRAGDRLPLLSSATLFHLGRWEFPDAVRHAGDQLALARAEGAAGWEGNALAMLATVDWARGRFDRARQRYEDAITASDRGGDAWRAALEQAQLARLHRDRAEPDAARAQAQRAIDRADAVGEPLARGLARDVMASIEHRWGRPELARGLLDDALGCYREVGYQEGEASAWQLAGLIAADPEASRSALRTALRIYARIGHRAGRLAVLDALAHRADPRAAAPLLAEADALRAAVSEPSTERGDADR